MRWLAAVFTCFGIASTPAIAGEDLPPGWRLPTPHEMAEEVRDRSPTRYARAVADLNADGIDETALLLKSTRFSGEALWVNLSSGASGDFKWVKLAEVVWGNEYPNVDLGMGIDLVPPGIHPYACFDNAKDCNFGPYPERPKLKLNSPSLTYFKLESAASLFFWSAKYKKFLRVWLSD